MQRWAATGLLVGGLLGPAHAQAQAQAPAPAAPASAATGFDAAMAERTGADRHGMRSYVFVLLRSGPNRLPPGPERDALFQGHFANMKRLSEAGHLVLAGPYDGVDGWRGLFILAVKDIEEAKRLAGSDPVLAQGEMVAEYHRYYGSAALMLIPELHRQLARESF